MPAMGIEIKHGNKLTKPDINTFVLAFCNRIYRHVFHEELGLEAKLFLKNLAFVVAGSIISALFSTIFTIFGGKLLGPDEYGKFILVQSVVNFLYVPMLLGFNTSMLKYACAEKDYQRKSNIIISSFILVLLFTAISVGAYLVFVSPLSDLFGVSTQSFYLIICFSGLFVLYTLSTSVLRALDHMKAYSFSQIIYGIVLLLSFLAFISDRQLGYKAMIYPVFIAYAIVIILIIILFIRKLNKWYFDNSLLLTLSRYSIFTVIGGLSYTFYANIDRIMIGRFMTVAAVGIYGAYYTSSINLAGLVWGIFNMVYFPAISGYKNKALVFRKINNFLPYLIGFGIPCILGFEYLILKLYGSKYPVDLFWMLCFSLASICIVVEGLYSWLLAAIGLHGAKISSFTAVAIAGVNVGLNFIVIPKYGISGAILCLIISYTVSIFLKLWIGGDYLKKGIDEDIKSEENINT